MTEHTIKETMQWKNHTEGEYTSEEATPIKDNKTKKIIGTQTVTQKVFNTKREDLEAGLNPVQEMLAKAEKELLDVSRQLEEIGKAYKSNDIVRFMKNLELAMQIKQKEKLVQEEERLKERVSALQKRVSARLKIIEQSPSPGE